MPSNDVPVFDGVTIADHDGVPRALLRCVEGVVRLSLLDDRSRERAFLGLDPDGEPRLTLLTALGSAMLHIGHFPDGTYGIRINRSDETVGIRIVIDPAGKPIVEVL